MAAWRYWRLYITADGGGGLADISDITMDISTVDQTDPTLAITAAVASSVFAVGLEAHLAFDASLTTRWASASGAYPQWIRYDFGLGNEKALDQVTVRIFSAANRGPTAFLIECSNDATSWVTAYTGSSVVWGSATERKTFTFTAPAPVPSDIRVSQLPVLILWGEASNINLTQLTTLVLGRRPGRRTMGITD